MYSKSRQVNKPVPPKISPVTLALQLISGERLIKEFDPEVSLWEILEHWESEKKLEPGLNSLTTEVPVCIYMRKEISAKDMLKSTTLLKLGIMNGKAAIRYATKKEGLKEQPHVGGMLAPTPRSVSPEPASVQPDQSASLATEMDVEAPALSDHSLVVEEVPQEVKMDVQETSVNIEMTEKSSTTVSDNADVAIEEEEDQIHFLNERGYLIYSRPVDDLTLIRQRSNQEEEDEFYELTDEEIRKMMKDLQQQSNQLQNAPLVTAQSRQAQEEQRRQEFLLRYPITILRIQFPDGLVLQIPLPSQSDLAEVKKDLLFYLDNPVNDVKDFVLYTAPPKDVLNTDISLHQLGLSPSSLIYIGPSNSNVCVTIKQEYKESLSTYGEASRDASRRLHQRQKSGDVDESLDQRSKRPAPSTSSSASTNVPKWLKMKR